jgi:hypothetical protein
VTPPSSAAKAGEEVKKVRLSVEEKEPGSRRRDQPEDLAERKGHASAGQQQVNSLYDCNSRLGSAPNSEKHSEKEKKGDDDEGEEKPEEKADRLIRVRPAPGAECEGDVYDESSF